MSEFNTMQTIKRRFFAMRNGALGDQLRRAGLDYKVIFGLNLPQIVEIAADYPKSPQLAEELWANSTTRESLLLAPMLYPPEQMDRSTAARWLSSAPTTEVVDVLCHRLLRRLEFAPELAESMARSELPLHRYGALRLLFNLFPNTAEQLKPIAEAEAARQSLSRPLALMILDEIAFLDEDI